MNFTGYPINWRVWFCNVYPRYNIWSWHVSNRPKRFVCTSYTHASCCSYRLAPVAQFQLPWYAGELWGVFYDVLEKIARVIAYSSTRHTKDKCEIYMKLEFTKVTLSSIDITHCPTWQSPWEILGFCQTEIEFRLYFAHTYTDECRLYTMYIRGLPVRHVLSDVVREPVSFMVTAVRKWYPDIGKTFGPLPDQRTSHHIENPSFTGPPKLLQDLI